METHEEQRETRLPTFGEAVTPIIFMVIVLTIGMGMLKWPTGVCLLLSAACAGGIAICRLNFTWEELEKFIVDKFAAVMPACLIVIFVAFMVATWCYSGTLAMLVVYGMQLISPAMILFLSFILTALLAILSGSSWGSVASIGVALMGVGIGLGVDPAMLAGALVSGAYFGDKMSPLSDTTNLAAGVTKTPLYEHIKYMFWTTIPSTIIALGFFIYLGMTHHVDGEMSTDSVLLISQLNEMYSFGVLPLLPMLVILLCTFTKKPPVPSMLLSAVVAVLVGWLYQGFDLWEGVSSTMTGFKVEMIGFNSSEQAMGVIKLLHRGGLNTQGGFLAFIICAMAFAGILTGTKMMDVAMGELTKKITTARSAILGSGLIAVVINALTGSDGLNKVITSELMNKHFLKLGIHPKVLARTLEDFGTMTGPAIPWTAAGLFMATTLGVPTMDYLPYCLLFFFSMIFATFYAITNISIVTITHEEARAFALKQGYELGEEEVKGQDPKLEPATVK